MAAFLVMLRLSRKQRCGRIAGMEKGQFRLCSAFLGLGSLPGFLCFKMSGGRLPHTG